MPESTHPAQLWVVCLCAAWCRTCEAYDTTFDSVLAQFPHIKTRWIDIEDEADLVGDLDIETFPTILIGNGELLLFSGPITPQPETLRRLLRAHNASEAAGTQASPAMLQLAQRLRTSFAKS